MKYYLGFRIGELRHAGLQKHVDHNVARFCHYKVVHSCNSSCSDYNACVPTQLCQELKMRKE